MGKRIVVALVAVALTGCTRQQVGRFGMLFDGVGAPNSYPAPTPPMRVLKGSYVSGLNRICVYDRGGSEYVETVGSAQLCPQ